VNFAGCLSGEWIWLLPAREDDASEGVLLEDLESDRLDIDGDVRSECGPGLSL
jgi:hypothetical protein